MEQAWRLENTNAAGLIPSLDRVTKEFSHRIRELKVLAMLKSETEESRNAQLQELSDKLLQAEKQMDELMRHVRLEKESLELATQATMRLRQATKRTVTLEKFLIKSQSEQALENLRQNFSDSPDASRSSTTTEETTASYSPGETEENTLTLLQKLPTQSIVTQVTIPSQQEWDKILPYKRKRVTYPQFALVCKCINSAAKRKQRLEQSSQQEMLGPQAKASLQRWKAVEDPKVKGLTFVLDEDVYHEVTLMEQTTPDEYKQAFKGSSTQVQRIISDCWTCLGHCLRIKVSEYQQVKRYIFRK